MAEPTILELELRLRSLEKGDVEVRVRKLEGILWVVTSLAVALGIGGAGLWTKLTDLRSDAKIIEDRLKELEGKRTELERNAETRLKQVIAQLEAEAQQSFSQFVASHRESLMNDYHRRLRPDSTSRSGTTAYGAGGHRYVRSECPVGYVAREIEVFFPAGGEPPSDAVALRCTPQFGALSPGR